MSVYRFITCFSLAIIAIIATSCNEPGPAPDLNDDEIYPSNLKSTVRFGVRVAGNDNFIIVGTALDLYVFKRSGDIWGEIETLSGVWNDFEVSDTHVAISFLEDHKFRTRIYSLTSGLFKLQKIIDEGSNVSLSEKHLIFGPVEGTKAKIYDEIAGEWKFSATINMPPGKSPLVAIGDTYALAGAMNEDNGADNYVVGVHKFEGGSWQFLRNIVAGPIGQIASMECSDEYVAVATKKNLEIYSIADAAAPPIKIPTVKTYISSLALNGSRVLVCDFDSHVTPNQVSTGEVGLYRIDAGAATIVTKYTTTNGPRDDYGNSVALTASYAFVGCPGDSDLGKSIGSVYVYKH